MLRVNNLVGFGAGGLRNFEPPTVIDQDAGNSTTYAWPATVANGQLCIIQIHANSGSSDTISAPSGFSTISQPANGSGAYYKILDGTETGNLSIDTDVKKWSLQILSFGAPISSVDLHVTNGERTAGNPASQSINFTGADADGYLFYCMSWYEASTVANGTYSGTFDAEFEDTSLSMKNEMGREFGELDEVTRTWDIPDGGGGAGDANAAISVAFEMYL